MLCTSEALNEHSTIVLIYTCVAHNNSEINHLWVKSDTVRKMTKKREKGEREKELYM